MEKKQSALVGFRESTNPRYIAEIEQCPILHAQMIKDISGLRQLINSLDNKHCIAQIEVAAGDEEIALIFRNLESLSEADGDKMRHFAQQNDYKIFLQPAGPDSVYCFYPADADPFLSLLFLIMGLIFAFILTILPR